MKKSRFISLVLILQILMELLQIMPVGAAPTPELFAYRIMCRSTVLRVDDPIAYVFNERTDVSDIMPYYEGSTAMVPVRLLAEGFTTEYSWESAKGGTFVVEQRNCAVIRIAAGKYITADGKEIKAEVPAVNKNGILYVPAKAFAEAMRLSYREDAGTGLLFFSREDETERHSKIDCERDILPYFDAAYRTNEKTYLYVATDGSDETGDGSMEKPYASLDRARLAVRELSENQKGDIIVYIRGGIYQISETVRFTPEDSGKNGYKIIYTAYEDEKPVFEGAKQVSGWKLYNGNIYVADVTGEDPIHMVFEDGKTVIKARHPNRDPEGKEARIGFLQTQGSADLNHVLSWNEGELPYVENTKDLELFVWPGGNGGHWMWHSQVVPLTKYNQETRKMTMSRKAMYSLGKGSRFFMMGAMEFLDAEGEFYHDTGAGKLYYIPYDYAIGGKRVTIPVTDDLISFEGTSQTETVRNIEISKLELRNSKRTQNMADYQKAYYNKTTGSGVKLVNAENCSVLDCYIHDLGGHGVFATEFVANLKIEGNKIHDPILHGVMLYTDTAFGSSNNIVSNNLVYGIGYLIGQSMGIELGGGGGNFATHNTVYNVVRAGLQLSKGETGHNYGGYNDLSDCNTSSEDTGVLYTINQKQGTGSTVYNNYIHDSGAGFMDHAGIYSDVVSDSVLTQNNIISRMQLEGKEELGGKDEWGGYYRGPFLLKGRDYKLINNIMANSVPPTYSSIILQNSTGTTSDGFTIERNIQYNNGERIYSPFNFTDRTITSVDNNVFYNEGTEEYTLRFGPVDTYEAWRKLGDGTFDANSITENPGFMDAEAEDFRLRYDSPAKILGIKTIKQSTIGVTEDFSYADESDEIWRLFINREGYSDTLSTMNLTSGESAQLNVTGRTWKGFVKTPAAISYSSDAPEVAQVDAAGRVTAISPGKAKITASVQDGSSTASISIYAFVDDELTGLTFNKDAYLYQKQKSAAVMPVGITRFGQILLMDEFDDIQFALKDNSSATVDGGGYVCFTENGTNVLTATATFNGKSLSATVELDCVETIIKRVKLKQSTLKTGEGTEANFEVVGISESGAETSLAGYECVFTSSNEAVAEISQQSGTSAVITGKNAGIAEIKVTVSWVGRTFESTAKLIVTAPSRFMNDWKISNYKNADGYAIEDENGISVYSSGEDIYYKQDDFTFVYQEESAADLTIEATVRDVDEPPSSIAGTGIMLRDEDTAGAFNVNVRYIPSAKNVIMTWRNTEHPNSGDKTVKEFVHHDPVKLRLQKKGDIIFVSCMDSEGNWQVVNELTVPFSGDYMAGVTSFSGGTLSKEMWFESRLEDVKIYEGAE